MTEGFERAVIDLRKSYSPYPQQRKFHGSAAPYPFLGGAAGPGKTTALLMENLISVNEFNIDDGKQVQTLMLRRTQPQVRNTLLTRFREKIDKSLYRKFNETSLTCTWHNNAVTQFGSMQYESDVFGWQGQWKDIYYDEVCDFVWGQWANIAAWNRCPVSPYARRLGAGNPVGVGAGWVRKIWVEHRPYDEMDANQKRSYKAEDYAYFPCTYLDNPIFANDPQFIAGLMSLPERLRMALMDGSWDVTGGYFTGAFDGAFNVIESQEFDPKPWHRQWISGDWGFEHWSALYRHYQDDFGVIRTGRELMIQHHDPEMLGERIIAWLVDDQGKFPKIVAFPFSHDAFASTATKTFGASANSVAMRLGGVLKPYGIPLPLNSGKDKLGREQTMYNLLRKEVWGGTKDATGQKQMVRNWLICDDCPKLIDTLIAAPRDDKRPEMIAEFSGDDPLQGAGYGVYHIVGRPAVLPREEQVRRELAAAEDPIQNYLIQLREHARLEKQGKGGDWWQ
jgi:hypothetical protein